VLKYDFYRIPYLRLSKTDPDKKATPRRKVNTKLTVSKTVEDNNKRTEKVAKDTQVRL
jgi:hypothetical protein